MARGARGSTGRRARAPGRRGGRTPPRGWQRMARPAAASPRVKIAGVDVDGVCAASTSAWTSSAPSAAGRLGFCDVVFGWDIADELYDNAQVTGWHTGYPDLHARVDSRHAAAHPLGAGHRGVPRSTS